MLTRLLALISERPDPLPYLPVEQLPEAADTEFTEDYE